MASTSATSAPNFGMRVDARADGRAAGRQLAARPRWPAAARSIDSSSCRAKPPNLLAQPQRRGVGQVRAADLDDLVPLRRPCRPARRASRSSAGIKSLLDRQRHGHVNRRGEHVVGALPHVDVVVGMDRLVGVRSGRRRAARWPDWRSPRWRSCCSTCPSRSETRRSGNWSSNLPSATSRQAASRASTCAALSGFLPVPVSLPRSRLATAAAYFTRPKAWINSPRQRPAGDRKVLDRALRLRAVVGLGGHADLAHRIALDAKLAHHAVPGKPVLGGFTPEKRCAAGPIRPAAPKSLRRFETLSIIAVWAIFTKADGR